MHFCESRELRKSGFFGFLSFLYWRDLPIAIATVVERVQLAIRFGERSSRLIRGDGQYFVHGGSLERFGRSLMAGIDTVEPGGSTALLGVNLEFGNTDIDPLPCYG